MKTQSDTLRFNAATGLKGFRFVTLTHATQTVAYTAADAAPDGITIADERNGVVEVLPIWGLSRTFIVELEGTVSVGDGIEVGTDGKGKVLANGITCCYARLGGVAGSLVEGYNMNSTGNYFTKAEATAAFAPHA